MNDRLFIRLLADQKALEWGLLNSQENPPKFLERGNLLLDDLIAIAELAKDKVITVLIPTEAVRAFTIDAPTRNRKHLEKAIPYLLEEQIIESVETQHFAFGDIDSNGLVSVNVIGKKYIDDLISRFKDADIEPDEMIADASFLPVFYDAWSLLDGNPVIVRQDNDTYWSAESEMVSELLQWNLNELVEENQSISQAVRVFSAQETPISFEGVAGLAVQKMPVDDELLWLVSQNPNQSINLLQQTYTPVKKSSEGIGYWKLPLIAACVAMSVGLIYFLSDVFILNQEKNHYRQLALEQVQRLSPNIQDDRLDSKLIEINGLYRKAAGGTGKNTGLIFMMDKVYASLNPRSIILEQLDFTSKQGTLNLDVRAENYQLLTSARESLEKSGLKVEMKNARDNSGSWTTRLEVKAN